MRYIASKGSKFKKSLETIGDDERLVLRSNFESSLML